MACLVLSTALQAAPSVQVVGLFPGAAVVTVDGVRKLVREGQLGPQNVRVLSVDRTGAVLDVGGASRHYPLTREYATSVAAKPVVAEVRLARDRSGHFRGTGSIDGFSVPFLVDTGATSIAMSEREARRLNVDYRTGGRPLVVATANGQAKAWAVKLDRVRLGAIELLGVEAVVVEGGAPSEVLLGMSFLNRVSWREQQGLLVMENKY